MPAPRKFDEETRARAVRLYTDHRPVGAENPSCHATCTYSWMRPPSRSRRSGRMVAPERGGKCGPRVGAGRVIGAGGGRCSAATYSRSTTVEVAWSGDQEVVEAFPAQCPDEAFRDRIAPSRRLPLIPTVGPGPSG